MYTRKMRYIMAAAFAALILIGVITNPEKYWEGIRMIPTVIAVVATRLSIVLAFAWVVTDLVAKRALGNDSSLRQLIERKDPLFQGMIVASLLIAIAILFTASM